MPSALDFTQVKLGNGFSTDPVTGSFFLNPTAVEDIASGAVDPLGVVTPARVGVMYVNTTSGKMFLATGATKQDWISMGVSVLFGTEAPTGNTEKPGTFYINANGPSLYIATGNEVTPWLNISAGGAPTVPAVSLGTDPPAAAPTTLGEVYFAIASGVLYVAVGVSSVNDWRPTSTIVYMSGGVNPLNTVTPPAAGCMYLWGARLFIALTISSADWFEVVLKEQDGTISSSGYRIGSTPVVAARQTYAVANLAPLPDSNFDWMEYNKIVAAYNTLVGILVTHGLIDQQPPA